MNSALMAQQLLANLRGEPLNIIDTLTMEQRKDYNTVKQRLIEHFGKTEEHYRKLFREIKLAKNADLKRTVHDMRQNMTKWLQLANCNLDDPKQILDFFLIENVLINVTDAAFSFLKERKIKNEAELISNLTTYKDSHPNITMV
uniref:Uncharacterized protein n=1 Tax=Biomphalaria glabrata TaxID=6526 RepID=A0A2C9LAC0_BIOGL